MHPLYLISNILQTGRFLTFQIANNLRNHATNSGIWALPKVKFLPVHSITSKELLASITTLLKKTRDKSSPALGQALDVLARDLLFFKNRTVIEGLKAASQ
jgi:hypothetical protein